MSWKTDLLPRLQKEYVSNNPVLSDTLCPISGHIYSM